MNYQPTGKPVAKPETPTGSGLDLAMSQTLHLSRLNKLAVYDAFRARLEHEKRSGVNVSRTTLEILSELGG